MSHTTATFPMQIETGETVVVCVTIGVNQIGNYHATEIEVVNSTAELTPGDRLEAERRMIDICEAADADDDLDPRDYF